jgi:GxxExxY protein
MNADERRWDELSERVIGAAFAVSNELGCGFLEKVYENALFAELTMCGVIAVQQAAIHVKYRGARVGIYYADLLVEDELIVEIKCVSGIDDIHLAQVLNYLKATGHRRALILNFAKPKLEIRRVARNY